MPASPRSASAVTAVARSGQSEARGFTLIEVLVALAILAVLANTIVFQSGNFAAQLFRLEEKTVALWVAQNALDEARLPLPPEGERNKNKDIEMGGRHWTVTRTDSDTSRPGFHRIEIGVARADEEGTVATLTGFVADR